MNVGGVIIYYGSGPVSLMGIGLPGFTPPSSSLLLNCNDSVVRPVIVVVVVIVLL